MQQLVTFHVPATFNCDFYCPCKFGCCAYLSIFILNALSKLHTFACSSCDLQPLNLIFFLANAAFVHKRSRTCLPFFIAAMKNAQCNKNINTFKCSNFFSITIDTEIWKIIRDQSDSTHLSDVFLDRFFRPNGSFGTVDSCSFGS